MKTQKPKNTLKGLIICITFTLIGLILFIPSLILQNLNLLPHLINFLLPVSQIVISVFGISAIIEALNLQNLFNSTIDKTAEKVINKTTQCEYIKEHYSKEYCKELIKYSYFPNQDKKMLQSFENLVLFFIDNVYVQNDILETEIYFEENNICKKTIRNFTIVNEQRKDFTYTQSISCNKSWKCDINEFSINGQDKEDDIFFKDSFKITETTKDDNTCEVSHLFEKKFCNNIVHNIKYTIISSTDFHDNAFVFKAKFITYGLNHRIKLNKKSVNDSLEICLFAIGKSSELGNSNKYKINPVHKVDSDKLCIYEIICDSIIFPGDGYSVQIKYS